VSETTPAQPDDTPWPAIVIGLVALGGLLLLAVWALGRRHGSQATWHSLAHQAAVDGTAAHDAALGALLVATTANDPERWRSVSMATGESAASVQRLVGSAPDDRSRLVAQQAFDAVTALGSAVDVAAMGPAAAPLDEGVALTLRQRLDEAQTALADLARSARG
jgi:hypothetical protein